MLTEQKLQKKRERKGAKRKAFRAMKNRLGEKKYMIWKSDRWKRKAEIKVEKSIRAEGLNIG